MLSPLARQPSNSLELDIIVIVPTPIERITRTYPARGDLAAYTRYTVPHIFAPFLFHSVYLSSVCTILSAHYHAACYYAGGIPTVSVDSSTLHYDEYRVRK